ncbi:MAG: hypothetical protein J2P16_00210 [Mycobacterium sp.]|nr:hypothetical protein [Mycobacterium sp.]
MTAPTRRIDRGRNHSYILDGRDVPGVTTILSRGLPKPALVGWAARTVAQTAVEQYDHWKDLSEGAATDWLRQSPYSDRDKAANRGTAVHHYAEQLAAGDEVEIPQELAGHVDAYLAFRDDWAPTAEIVEAVVVNRTCRYMGTLDLVCNIDGLGRCLIDLKTNRSGPFGDMALQLAAYRYAETFIDDTGTEQPMPHIDWTGVLWLRTDGYDLHPFVADADTFRVFRYIQQVAWWIDNRERAAKGDAIYPPAPPELEVVS